tara:strand:- start:80 stop:820 length:741 start_codon:yes stop_codon:yes gene_type:complete
VDFYLGADEAYWLGKVDFPLMVARQRLFRDGAHRRPLPTARVPWVLDSGGFTQLHKHGRFPFEPEQYVTEVLRLSDEVGNLRWAAPMDWMCEAGALKMTGLTVTEHQKRTVHNFLDLRQHLGSLVIPVLQGWERDDYLRCADLYTDEGVDLHAEDTIGLGSICRRNADDEIVAIIESLDGLRLHAFGVKGRALARVHHRLASSDSMAWSYRARRGGRHPDCTHRRCNHCRKFARLWRDQLLETLKG